MSWWRLPGALTLVRRQRLSSALTVLQALRGATSGSHVFAEPARPEDIESARSRLSGFPSDLARLYRFADGFSLFDVEGDSNFELLSLGELHTFRDVVDGDPAPYDYALLGDPDRLRVFAVGNGGYLSYSELGVPGGAWLDDDREGIQGVVARSIGGLILAAIESENDGVVSLSADADMPEAYDELMERLGEQAGPSEAPAGAVDPEANDWSDVMPSD